MATTTSRLRPSTLDLQAHLLADLVTIQASLHVGDGMHRLSIHGGDHITEATGVPTGPCHPGQRDPPDRQGRPVR
jgi:hypothetical protein